jgi:hypothetical protein
MLQVLLVMVMPALHLLQGCCCSVVDRHPLLPARVQTNLKTAQGLQPPASLELMGSAKVRYWVLGHWEWARRALG